MLAVSVKGGVKFGTAEGGGIEGTGPIEINKSGRPH